MAWKDSENVFLCNPQMPLQSVSCKDEFICEHNQRQQLLWTKVNLKCSEAKWKIVLWLDESEF